MKGIIVNDVIIKVPFINQLVDSNLMKCIGEDITYQFEKSGISKIMTIESGEG